MATISLCMIVKDEEETVDTTALEAAIKSAENLTESDYTAASWSDLCVELKEAKDELAAPHTQSTVDEATEHLNAAIKALVKAETKEETKTVGGIPILIINLTIPSGPFQVSVPYPSTNLISFLDKCIENNK